MKHTTKKRKLNELSFQCSLSLPTDIFARLEQEVNPYSERKGHKGNPCQSQEAFEKWRD
jgi:hypothetical protein